MGVFSCNDDVVDTCVQTAAIEFDVVIVRTVWTDAYFLS